jgi:hypothetical protein
MRPSTATHLRLSLLIPAFVGLAACSASDSTGPSVLDPSPAAAAKGSGSGGDPVTAPTPVPGTVTGTWKGTLLNPAGSQATTFFLRQEKTEVTGDAFFVVSSTTTQRLRINRGYVFKDGSVAFLLVDGNGKESLVRYAGQLSADGKQMTGSVIDLRGPVYALDLTLQ